MYSPYLLGAFLLLNCVTQYYVSGTQLSKIITDLEGLGFTDQLRSDDDYASSLYCRPCQKVVTYTDVTKLAWLLRRHSETERHKMLSGWTLTADYKPIKTFTGSKYSNEFSYFS